MSDKEKLIKLKELAKKYGTAKEYYDNLIEMDFTPMSLITQKFVRQLAEEMLEIIDG